MAEVSSYQGIWCDDCSSAVEVSEIGKHYVIGCTVEIWQCDGCNEAFETEAEAEECCPEDEDE